MAGWRERERCRAWLPGIAFWREAVLDKTEAVINGQSYAIGVRVFGGQALFRQDLDLIRDLLTAAKPVSPRMACHFCIICHTCPR
jgi:hypothetical protein